MVRGHTPSIFTHDLYIPEIFRPKSLNLSAADSLGLSSSPETALRMYKEIQGHRNWYQCDVLLVFNCNYAVFQQEAQLSQRNSATLHNLLSHSRSFEITLYGRKSTACVPISICHAPDCQEVT